MKRIGMSLFDQARLKGVEAICKAAVDAMKPVCPLPSRACVTSTAKVTLERSTAYCREARRNQLSQREYSEYTKDMAFFC